MAKKKGNNKNPTNRQNETQNRNDARNYSMGADKDGGQNTK